jgi:protein-disulfide isomerase
MGWLFVAVVLAFGGCIEKRRGAPKDAAANGKANAAAPAAVLATRDQVDDALSNLVEGDRVRAEYAAGDPWKGAAQPLVTIIEFSDFECPFCSKLASTLESVVARYPDDVRLVFKQFPLAMHARAEPAARAAVAAHAQGKFWEMHDKLFADRSKLSDADIRRHAEEIGLDVAKFEKDLADPATQAKVAAEMNEGRVLEVASTPTFFVNGRKVQGAKDLDSIVQIVEEERATANRLLAGGSKRSEIYARIMRAAQGGKGEAQPVDPTHRRGEASKVANYAIPTGAARPSKGPDSAPVTIVWFVAYGCADCKTTAQTIADAVAAKGDGVRLVVRQFPAEGAGSELVARTLIAAHAQGKFWPLHDALVQLDAPPDGAALRAIATDAKLDIPRLATDMESAAAKAILAEDIGVADKVRGTQAPPFAFVNGRWLATNPPREELDALVVEETGKAETFRTKNGVPAAELYEAMRKTWRGAAQIDEVPLGPPGDTAGKDGVVPAAVAEPGTKTDTFVRGGRDAKVQIVACTDFDCPACSRSAKALAEVLAEYGDRVAVQFRHQLGPNGKAAEKAHRAALAAGKQGKFWEMHDLLVKNRVARSDAALAKLATKAGLDVAAFERDMADPVHTARIEEDVAACTSLGMKALPAFSVNGTVLKGGQTAANFKAAIEAALAAS